MAQFNFTRITDSIVNPNVDRQNAVDADKPLSFLEWLKQVDEQGSAKDFIDFYNCYVNEWYDSQGVVRTAAERIDSIKDQYTSLFKDIVLNFATQAEKRFILNINYNDPVDVDAVIPFFSKKIKEICFYFKGKREEVKQAVKKYETIGTNLGVSQTIRNVIFEALQIDRNDAEFDTSNITLSAVADNLAVEIEEHFDTYGNYYDLDPSVPASTYEVDKKRERFFTANTNDIDANLFIDFDQAIIDEIKSVPFVLQSLGLNFTINPDVDSTDLQFLKKRHFTPNTNTGEQDDLRLNLKKELIEKYSGSDFYYLSTNTMSQYVTGQMFEADNAAKNFLNRRFPSTATVPMTSTIATPREVGRFFKPDKLGILLFKAPKKTFEVNTAALSANTVYIFPDPFKYSSNVRGLTRNTYNIPIVHTIDSSELTYDASNGYKFGDVNIPPEGLSFFGYESR